MKIAHFRSPNAEPIARTDASKHATSYAAEPNAASAASTATTAAAATYA